MTETSHPRFTGLRQIAVAVAYLAGLALLFWYGQTTAPPGLERVPLAAELYLGGIAAVLSLSAATYVATRRWHASHLPLITRFTTWLPPVMFVTAAVLAHRYGTKLFWLALVISNGCNLAKFCALPHPYPSSAPAPGEPA